MFCETPCPCQAHPETQDQSDQVVNIDDWWWAWPKEYMPTEYVLWKTKSYNRVKSLWTNIQTGEYT